MIDSTDRKILAALSTEGRLTVTELAERVHLSASRCHRRLRELEQGGVIRGYHADLNASLLGLDFEVLGFVTMQSGDTESLSAFDLAVEQVPHVIRSQRLFGEVDYLLRVVCADLASYQRLYEETLTRLPNVQRITSTIVMKDTEKPYPLANNPIV